MPNARAKIVLAAALFAPLAARAATANVSADTTISTALTTTNFGTRSNLVINSTSTALLKFDFTSVPAGTPSSLITKAVLYVYVNRLNTSAAVSLYPVTTTWSELTVTNATKPTIGTTATTTATPATTGAYLAFDITSTVAAWITTPANNFGIALSTATADLQLDSKENDATGHSPFIDININTASAAAAAPIGPPIALTVPGPTGPRGTPGPQGPIGPPTPTDFLYAFNTSGKSFTTALPFDNISTTGSSITQVSPATFTINTSGTYRFDYFADNSPCSLVIRKNNLAIPGTAVATSNHSTTFSGLLSLAAGDTISLAANSAEACAVPTPLSSTTAATAPVSTSFHLLRIK